MSLNYLYTPIQKVVGPPVTTNSQELPLEKLLWEDFEKLCLAIIQLSFSINDCEIYGTKGQSQQGIDIYARQSNGRYSSYQCKKYQEFDLTDLISAVTYFKEKAFYSKSDSLYLCTSCEWNKTQIQNKFEELKTELASDNITLVKWDKIQLSRHLKNHPKIVYDFFGIEWVKKFNGELSLAQISKSKKLDASAVVKYRKELYEFYSTIFNIQDPGIPITEIGNPYSIQERFIIPDILLSEKGEYFDSIENIGNDSAYRNFNQEQEQLFYEDYWYGQSELNSKNKKKNSKEILQEENVDIRIKVDDALTGNNKNIIIGDPGAGKSTLLRFIILDILGNTPTLENISLQYGKLLPVWLPFAFITKHLDQNDTLNISEILKLWFKSFDKEYLFDIAKEALNDDRLFLIIDGIDEWSNISSAQQAITRIETIREFYDCQILYSSRPYGFRMLKDFFVNLKVLQLVGFSQVQQRKFAKNWYSKWALSQKNITDYIGFAEKQSALFIKDLEQTDDLRRLAEIPLLLSILIIQKINDSVLPKSKLEALKEITQYLINKHPAKRVIAAGIVLNKPDDIDYKGIFCELAIHIQSNNNDGVITKQDAEKTIEKYLTTYASYDKARARLRSKELLELGANDFGIIIEKSPEEISFSHKQFQEFLAAQYLFESDEEFVNNILINYGASPTFYQVIINFFGLIPQKQVKKFANYFNVLKKATHEVYQADYLKLLSYAIAINIDTAPLNIMNNCFDAIIKEFEYETDLVFKEALLKRILKALTNVRLKDKVQDFLLHYIPNENKYRDIRVTALNYKKQVNNQELEFLQKALINGTLQIRYDVSNTFKTHIKDCEIFDFVKDIILNCGNPDILAFAINSVITPSIKQSTIDNLLNPIRTESYIVRFFLLKNKIFSKQQLESELDEIVRISDELPYELKQELTDLLIEGYGESEKLKNISILSVRRQHFYGEKNLLNKDIAWKVLFHCFNKDNEVIQLLKHEFETQEYPLSPTFSDDMLKHLIHYFGGNQELIPVVEQWLLKRLEKYNFHDRQTAFASIFAHTESIKKLLLKRLPDEGLSHWIVLALLDGWENDESITNPLKNYFRQDDPVRTSASAHFIPRIFLNEKEEAIQILEKFLFEHSLSFRNRAIPALIEFDKSYFENDILPKLLNDLDTFPKGEFGQYYDVIEHIVNNFYSNSLVENYITKHVETDNNLQGFWIRYYSDHSDKGYTIFDNSLPLAKELRLLIIEYLNELFILPKKVEIRFYNFRKEEDDEVKGNMAICLFKCLKHSDINKIVELSRPLVFARGIDVEILRNIAFCGFLIAKKLPEYFSLEDTHFAPSNKARPMDFFSDYGYHRHISNLMAQCLIDNFDYFILIVGIDFKTLSGNSYEPLNVENIWGFFAKHSHRSSSSYTYILNFINENINNINNQNLISFLNRVLPQSLALKNILLKLIKEPKSRNKALAGRLLGTNFKNDEQVYQEMKTIKDCWNIGRIIALCTGWPDEPVLKEQFQELIKHQYEINNYAGFYLKFLFRDIDNLKLFLSNVLSYPEEYRASHKYFFIPLLERLKKDTEFGMAIKNLLLTTTSTNEKISYFNLLSQANMTDDNIIKWKNSLSEFKNDYGYDIVSNITVRLKNILYDYYF